MSRPSVELGSSVLVLVIAASVLLPGLSSAQTASIDDIEVLDESVIVVNFQDPVKPESLKQSNIMCYSVQEDPKPWLKSLIVGAVEPLAEPLDDGTEAVRIRFEGQPFSDHKAVFTLILRNFTIRSSDSLYKEVEEAKATFSRYPEIRLQARSRRSLRVFDAYERLSKSFRELADVEYPLLVEAPLDQQLAVFVSEDNVSFSEYPVSKVQIVQEAVHIQLGRPLPGGKDLYVKGTLPGLANSELSIPTTELPKKSIPLAIPTERTDKGLSLYLDLAYISDGAQTDGGRDDEGLLDLLFKPKTRLFREKLASSNWVVYFNGLLDAKVGTDDPDESKADNSIKVGGELAFARVTSWGETRFRTTLQHNSDRDFDTRELVSALSYTPWVSTWNVDVDRRTYEARRETPTAPVPTIRSWAIVPTIGIELGRVVAASTVPADGAEGGRPLPVRESDSFLRYKFSLKLQIEVCSFTVSVTDTFRYLDFGTDKEQNLLSASIAYNVTSNQAIVLKFKDGHDAPTFERVDTRSIAYQMRF